MKTIGLIGGMSWESTTSYYQIINETIKKELGGLHSAKILLYSVDFAEVEHYQAVGDWEKSGRLLADIAKRMEQAGADFIVICTNTMHKVAPQIQEQIAQATAQALSANGIQKVGLLGTKYTMTQDFYKEKLIESGLEVLIPDQAGITEVNRIIYDELCLGDIKESSKQTYLAVIDDLKKAGAEVVILGCTEIGLLVKQSDTDLPLYDTTVIHAEKAAEWAVNK
ncbi:aspartate/glutamate racemase family protein [Streptococcus constellatus]|uniref:aspartate/glutamate racemase family protein n=1 Tax=Streptococcus constellatus TaxID=76860 RepID=UPI00200066ED|nr:aspartate/glutamate racemase family protein [Streptococcus constellatus]